VPFIRRATPWIVCSIALRASLAGAEDVTVAGAPAVSLTSADETVMARPASAAVPVTAKPVGPGTLVVGYRRDMGSKGTRRSPGQVELSLDGAVQMLSIEARPDSRAKARGSRDVLSEPITNTLAIGEGVHAVRVRPVKPEAGYVWFVFAKEGVSPSPTVEAEPPAPKKEEAPRPPEPAQIAMTAFSDGFRLYRSQRFQEALQRFEEAQRAKPGAGLLRKIAACREKTGDLSGARAALAEYVSIPAAPERSVVERDLARIDAAIVQSRPKPGPPPRIDFTPVTSGASGQPLVVAARAHSPDEGRHVAVTLFVRLPGISNFARVEMKPEAGSDRFTVELTADITEEDFDYYLEAVDTGGGAPSKVGSAEAPLHFSPTAPPVQPRRVPPRRPRRVGGR
jgi:hypothetical protein